MGLRIERCDSVACGAEIKALFLRNGRPTFPAFFDRAYPAAVSAGGASWVARNERGAVVGHQAVFPRVFWDTGRVVRAALFVDSVFDRTYRNFWNPLELCRETLANLGQAHCFDFAYTDPTPSSHAVLRAAGFTTISLLQRYVLPLHPLYLGFYRFKSRTEALSVTRVDHLGDASVEDALRRLQPGPRFRAKRSLELYATRLGGETMPRWQWLLLRPQGEPHSPVAALVLATRPSGHAVLNLADVLWDEARASMASVLHAVARTAPADGIERLSVVTLAESRLARSLEQCGFIRRKDSLPLVLRHLHPDAALPPVQDWLITAIDGSAW